MSNCRRWAIPKPQRPRKRDIDDGNDGKDRNDGEEEEEEDQGSDGDEEKGGGRVKSVKKTLGRSSELVNLVSLQIVEKNKTKSIQVHVALSDKQLACANSFRDGETIVPVFCSTCFTGVSEYIKAQRAFLDFSATNTLRELTTDLQELRDETQTTLAELKAQTN